MEKQHLTYFKIENFKRFDSFEMSNLGQFNLIVGDNNVGKTSALEALLFDEDISTLAHNYYTSTVARGLSRFHLTPNEIQESVLSQTDFWSFIFRNLDEPITITVNGIQTEKLLLSLKRANDLTHEDREYIEKTILFSSQIRAFIKLVLVTDNTIKSTSLLGAYFEEKGFNVQTYIPYISANISYGDSLLNYFYQYFNTNKEIRRELESNLRLLIPKLEEIRTHKIYSDKEVLGITLTDSNDIYPIMRYGDGTVKLLRILLEILVVRDRRLMVDEIGAGIHFTRLKDYWKTIVQLCFKYNVQLFATTHSLECQQAFIEALEDQEMQQYQKYARNISLIENKQGKVKAVTYDFDQFEYALNIGFNTRGGAR